MDWFFTIVLVVMCVLVVFFLFNFITLYRIWWGRHTRRRDAEYRYRPEDRHSNRPEDRHPHYPPA